eukprot:14034904-Alexandrium_andersonii.AAC.1
MGRGGRPRHGHGPRGPVGLFARDGADWQQAGLPGHIGTTDSSETPRVSLPAVARARAARLQLASPTSLTVSWPPART